jgi:hypothetical protein
MSRADELYGLLHQKPLDDYDRKKISAAARLIQKRENLLAAELIVACAAGLIHLSEKDVARILDE